MTENVIIADNRRAQRDLRPNIPEFKWNAVPSVASLRRSLTGRDSKVSNVTRSTRVNYSQLNMGLKMQKTLATQELDLNNIFKNDSQELPLEFFDDFNFEELFEHAKLNLLRHSALAFLPEVYENLTSNIDLASFKSSESLKEPKNDWVEVQIVDYNEKSKLFRVIDEINFEEHQLPSIKINFWNEDSTKYVERVKRAIEFREKCKRMIKYEAELESHPLIENTSMPQKISLKMKLQIDKAENGQKIKLNEIVKDFEHHFKKCQAAIDTKLSEFSSKKASKKNLVQLNYDFKTLRHDFRWKSIYCQPEVFNAMFDVSNICSDISSLCLFNIEKGTEMKISDFDKVQKSKITEITNFLQTEWPENLAQVVYNHFKNIKIGWFNIRISNWEVYLISKLYRFMLLVQQKMQEALQALICSSIQQYINWLCEPCITSLDVSEDFEWDEDLIQSPFDSEFPIFHLVLQMNESLGAHFSSNVDTFSDILLSHFDTVLLNTHFIKIIDPMVLQCLLYEPGLCISSIGLMDERITEPRNYLKRCYEKAIIPLKAYASRYNEQLEFFLMKNETFVENFKSENHTMLEIKEEILMNIDKKQELEEKLPISIVIGPFFVLIEPLKRILIRKRNDLIQKLMKMLNDLIRDKTMKIVLQYREIFNRLFEPPSSVEFLFETQNMIETLPELIKSTEEEMRVVLYDYEILDFFHYVLTNEDCALKWEAIRWPNRILSQINVTQEQQILDIEKFQKEQVSETSSFDKTLESLTVQVQEYQFKDDATKVTQNAQNCKKLSENLLITQKLGRTLNERQLLFNLPELELENIDQLIVSFKPYETLWFTAANFYHNREVWLNEKIACLNVHDIFEALENSKNIFMELVDDFEEIPRIQAVCNSFLAEIRSFEPILELMQDFTHFCWSKKCFKSLNEKTGMKISLETELSTQNCIEEGILKKENREMVKVILKQAIEDHHKEEITKAEEAEKRRKEEEILEARRQRRLARTDI
ncbi:dynein axonemal heavy chain 1 [Culicoides brevitarsis]|uniref:dynein axonemal heavy chain 1 n=1 Tax=Culicoides brevitarsis TaxID=469753 RepID=UPI00307CA808